jgi:hypothetical protein
MESINLIEKIQRSEAVPCHLIICKIQVETGDSPVFENLEWWKDRVSLVPSYLIDSNVTTLFKENEATLCWRDKDSDDDYVFESFNKNKTLEQRKTLWDFLLNYVKIYQCGDVDFDKNKPYLITSIWYFDVLCEGNDYYKSH